MSDVGSAETIVAIATAAGRGGIGIVRLSGPEALAVAGRVVRLGAGLEHGRVRRGQVFGEDGSLLDEALVTAFFAPRSYTGEDVVEIAAHGAPVVLEAVLRMCLGAGKAGPSPMAQDDKFKREDGGFKGEDDKFNREDDKFKRENGGFKGEDGRFMGEDGRFKGEDGRFMGEDGRFKGEDGRLPRVRLAEPGEFTRRAFLSGRLDLTQAEAVGDLIAAQTLDQARVAAQQMGGAMSRRVAPAKEALLQLIAVLEAGMDFASGELDDVDVVPAAVIAAKIGGARAPLALLAEGFRRGQIVRRGAAIALIGRPNAGKSSLFNRLLERERAIVTPVAGTTRDTVEETMSLGGVPLRLIDTAGLRVGGERDIDEAEAMGMERSREALADADLVLVVEDVTAPLYIDEGLERMLEGRPHLRVRNKVDLVASRDGDGMATSALTGEGLEALRAAMLRELGAEGALADSGAIHTLRQQEAVGETLRALETAAAANEAGLPHEVLLMDLHAALRALDSLTGTTTTDDILGRIFSTFCIGK